MKKILIWLVLVILLANLLTACRQTSPVATQSVPSTRDITGEPSLEFDLPISTSYIDTEKQVTLTEWEFLIGNPPAIEEPLSILEANETLDSMYIFGNQYYAFVYPDLKLGIPYGSGWQIELNLLTVIGKTTSGKVILAPDNEAPLFYVSVDESGEQCYFREDIFNRGIAGFEFSDFIVHCDNTVVTEEKAEELVWLHHTEKEGSGMRGGVLDGKRDYGTMRLIHSECPALQYVIGFHLCEGMLYMEDATGERGEGWLAMPIG